MSKQKVQRKRGILIRVTAEDIEKGVPHSAAHCPIARAAKRQFGEGVREVLVCKDDMDVLLTNRSDYYALSRSAGRFIDRFDARRAVYPFSFFATKLLS